MDEEKFTRMGGWLLFYVIVSVIGLVYLFTTLLINFDIFIDLRRWDVVDNNKVDKMLAALVIFSIASILLQLVILTLILIKSLFRQLPIVVLLQGLIVIVGWYFVKTGYSNAFSSVKFTWAENALIRMLPIVIQAAISILIWFNYFKNSRRVEVYMNGLDDPGDA